MAETCPGAGRIHGLITKIICKQRLKEYDRRDIANALLYTASRIEGGESGKGISMVAAPKPQRPNVSLDEIMDLMRRLERGEV